MSFVDWIFGRVATEPVTVTIVYEPEHPRPLPPPDEDEELHIDEEEAILDEVEADTIARNEQPRAEEPTITLEPVFATIDYEDAAGKVTRRGITLFSLRPGPNAPLLTAKCHARKAIRSFRTDRIECFIEPDGEVVDCADFFQNVLGVGLETIKPRTEKTPPKTKLGEPRLIAAKRARPARERLRSPLAVLVTAARSDGVFCSEEVETICRYAEGELLRPESGRDGTPPDVRDLDLLPGLIQRMRPHRSTLASHIEAVAGLDDEAYRRFRKALCHVIAADRQITSEEQMIVSDLDEIRTQYLEDKQE